MYVPKHFTETDAVRLHALMRAHAFATLVSHMARAVLERSVAVFSAGAKEPWTLASAIASAMELLS